MGSLSVYPSHMVGALSAGFGLSGTLGAALCILFQALDLSILADFCLLTPLPVIFLLVYFFWLQEPTPEEISEREKLNHAETETAPSSNAPTTEIHQTQSSSLNSTSEDISPSIQNGSTLSAETDPLVKFTSFFLPSLFNDFLSLVFVLFLPHSYTHTASLSLSPSLWLTDTHTLSLIFSLY